MELHRKQKILLFAVIIIYILFIGYIDYVISPTVGFSAFYFAAIAIAALYVGRTTSYFSALFSWLIGFANHVGVRLNTPLLPQFLLDQFFSLVIFLMVAYAASRISQDYLTIKDYKRNQEFELDLARRVQMSMRPAVPADDKFEIAGKTIFSKVVGGDFYEITKAGGKLIIGIADISGRGIFAALFSALLRDDYNEALSRHMNPADVIPYLNTTLSRQLPADMFVSFFYMTVDLETLEARYINAGHEPPVWFRSRGDETTSLANPEPFLLGVNPETKFIDRQIRLQSGDILLLYTDGILEPSFAPPLNYEAIASLVEKNHDLSPSSINEAILAALGSGEQNDDITLACLKVK